MTIDVPAGSSYSGPAGIARDSPWLTAEDLPDGKDVVVEVADVQLYPEVTYQGGRTKKNQLALVFRGKERQLGLNATNRKVLAALYGNLCGGWVGKRITLYVDPHVRMAGKEVRGVRIRDSVPRGKAAVAEPVTNPISDEPITTEAPGREPGEE
jgi:hypothetical protein